MKRNRRRKCLCCGDLYMPGRHNAYHQKYCRKPACRKASRQASQRRWLAKPANRGYHCGAEAAARVHAWRQAHPGYGARKATPLQDLLSAQNALSEGLASVLKAAPPACAAAAAPPPSVPQAPAEEGVAAGRRPAAGPPAAVAAGPQAAPLQDLCLSQEPLFVGLISMLTDTLQDDIVPVMARLQTRGRAILGKGPGTVPKGAMSP